MSKAEATKIAKQYVDKHRKNLKASNKEVTAAVNKIAKVLTEMQPVQNRKTA